MKSWLSAGVGVLFLLQSQVWGQELLTNPGLDDPDVDASNVATGWTLVEPDHDAAGGPVNSAEFVRFGNHNPGGARQLWFRSFEGGLGGDEPSTVDAHLYQDVPGTPGSLYTVSAWYRYENHYSGTNLLAPTGTELALEFLKADASLIGSAILDVDAVYPGTDDWFQVSIQGIAPLGTAIVRVRASMLDGILADANPQSAFVDDFSLTPEPASAILLLLAGFALPRRQAGPRLTQARTKAHSSH